MARAGTAKTRLVDGQRVPIDTNAPITSEMAMQTPSLNVTRPTPATEMAGLGGAIELSTSNYLKDLDTRRQAAEQRKNDSFSAYLESAVDAPGEIQLRDEAYADTVDPLEAELKDINQQILEEQHGLRRRIEAIERNPEGNFAGGMAQEVDRVTRESISKQADLSVIQMARQGRYDSAKAIADRQVAARLELTARRNEALRLTYQENKDLFTTAEQRAFEAAQTERERAFAKEEATLKQISDLSIQALVDGAPASVAAAMRGAKTVEEAISIGGQYVGALDRQYKQASIASIYDQIFQRSLPDTATIKEIREQSAKNDAAIADAKEISRIVTDIQGLINAGDSNFGRRLPEWMRPISALGTRDFDATVAQLKAILTKEKLGALRGLGAMSDREFSMIGAAATKLDTGLSKKAFEKELQTIVTAITPTLGILTLQEDDLGEIDQMIGVNTQQSIPAFNPSNFYR